MTTTTRTSRSDTIAAPATAAGAAAVAIVRVSGPSALALAEAIAGPGIRPRRAVLRTFRDAAGETIDHGLVLYFPAPASFTGEDVAELQCHGSPMVVDWLLETLYAHGARPAAPGEFSLRAFLNDKFDLTQAEAIADLIAAGSRDAARAAGRSLEGEFAAIVADVQARLTELRVRTEAWLDFPEEELDAGTVASLKEAAGDIGERLGRITATARAGLALTDGLSIAIAGPPNAGKSSLLNRLSRSDAAIVSDRPGTTRDALHRQVVIGGLPVELVDTAGLHDTADAIEREGIERARAAFARADLVLWVADVRDEPRATITAAMSSLPAGTPFALLLNKVDLLPDPGLPACPSPAAATARTGPADVPDDGPCPDLVATLRVSVLEGTGMEQLVALIAARGGATEVAGAFSARRRHLQALESTDLHLRAAATQLATSLDIAAEELRAAQVSLSELTGEVTSDDLLGAIFATFCIGK